MALNKLARVIAVTTAIGGISLAGIQYASEYDSIEEAVNDLKQKALDWQKRAGINKAELNAMTEKFNTLEANYKAVLSILKIDEGADIEEVKAKVQDIYNNATSTGIEGTNLMLESIAEALGITLTEEDMNENGVYKTDKILEELENLDDELDNLQEALGTLDEEGKIVIDRNAGDVEYSEDMSLSEKINYLIGQINTANKEQQDMKVYVNEVLNSVDEASADYVYEEENEGEASGDDTPRVEDEVVTLTKEQAKQNVIDLLSVYWDETAVNNIVASDFNLYGGSEGTDYIGSATGTRYTLHDKATKQQILEAIAVYKSL